MEICYNGDAISTGGSEYAMIAEILGELSHQMRKMHFHEYIQRYKGEANSPELRAKIKHDVDLLVIRPAQACTPSLPWDRLRCVVKGQGCNIEVTWRLRPKERP